VQLTSLGALKERAASTGISSISHDESCVCDICRVYLKVLRADRRARVLSS
jgi:hypothetical protein